MSRVALLDTSTSTFEELIGNGKLYRVPPFQRDYSWREEQWEDLWQDLLAVRASPDDRHYMGAFVVQDVGRSEFQVIDGQQRLATLSILVLAAIRRLAELPGSDDERRANAERAELLRERFIGRTSAVQLKRSSKLRLNQTDDAFYQDTLIELAEPDRPSALRGSRRRMWECFTWFLARLREDASLSTGEALTALFEQTVGPQLVFIRIGVDDEAHAYTVFETLNARGLELSSTDLLKNDLFSRMTTKEDLEYVARRWSEIVGLTDQDEFPDFLRLHLLCERPQVRQRRMFKLVRDAIRTPAEVKALLDSLTPRAHLFSALQDAADGYWDELPGAPRRWVRELNLFRARQMTPLLFAVWERFSPEDRVRVLKLVATLTFRYTVVAERSPTDLEQAYHHAARGVLTGELRKPRQVYEELARRRVVVADDELRQRFALLAVRETHAGAKLARYILSRLEAEPDEDPPGEESFTLEHVLPQNPSADWRSGFAEPREAVALVGNLVPLERHLNRRLGAASFAEKRAAYAGSRFRLAREVADEGEWTLATLQRRQERLAERACRAWGIDFA